MARPAFAPRRAASPSAKPVTLVNMTWAKGDRMPRTKNVAVVSAAPPSMKLIAKYWMFSVKAKPAPTSAP